jgi:hypothetical protein
MPHTNTPSAPMPITIDYALSGIIETFDIEDERKAKVNFETVIVDLYNANGLEASDTMTRNIDVSFKLMRSLKPVNDKEKVHAAQAVVCQVLGMNTYSIDQKASLKLLKSSNWALRQIKKNRQNMN